MRVNLGVVETETNQKVVKTETLTRLSLFSDSLSRFRRPPKMNIQLDKDFPLPSLLCCSKSYQLLVDHPAGPGGLNIVRIVPNKDKEGEASGLLYF